MGRSVLATPKAQRRMENNYTWIKERNIFLLHKGSEEKKREERSSQEVMNITLFFVLSH